MKKEKIEELFNQNALNYSRGDQLMDLEEFTSAISQVELEWCDELEKNLSVWLSSSMMETDSHIAIAHYRNKIQCKIKELKNGHSQDR